MTAFPHIRLSKSAILGLGALAAMVSAPAARSQTVFDAQVPFSFSSPTLTTPRGIAVATDGTVYIADPAKGVVRITPPASGAVSGAARAAASLASTATLLAPSVTIAKPTAVTLDSTGALYISDGTDHLVIEMASPETSAAATTITYPGTETPTALAVDSSNNLYVADETQDAIYRIVSGTATKLNLSSAVLKPVGLAVDSSGNVYFADAHNNFVYKYTASTNTAASYLTTSSAGNFRFSATTTYPIGMGFDPAGSLYVLDNDTGNLIQVVSPSTSTSNIELPLSAALTPSGMTVSSIGNIYVSDDTANTADEVYYNNNPFNYGSVSAGTNSPAVTVNFQFVGRERNTAIYQTMQGDISTEFHTQSTTCAGTADTECSMAFYVDYSSALPGTRNGAVGLTDSNGEMLAAPNTGIDLASALALYPGTQATLSQTAQTLYEPQGMAVTGDGGTLFVADEGGVISGGSQTFPHPNVWAYAATAGTPSGAPTQVGEGGFATPDAVALDANGDLFVADYSGYVSEIPVVYDASTGKNTWPGFGTKLNLTLNHPMALAFDPSGNLYIGDMGSAGTAATVSSPGYIIKVPANGGPATKLAYTVGGEPIVFPQALAADSQGNLYIADGGDGSADLGGVDVVSVSTGAVNAISFGSFGQLSQPSGLGFDAANDLYVLDGYNQRVLVVPVSYTGTVPSFDSGDITLLGQGLSGLTSALVTPTNMVVWQGGQYISFADIGYQPASGTSSPVQVLTLQSVNTSVDASSGSVSVTGVDVGNEEITFLAPSKTGSVAGGAAFSYSGCGSAGNTLEPGIVPNCTNTITYNGSGTATQTATFTLNGNASLDGSALGNEILVSGTPEYPVGVWSGGGLQGSTFGTVTLTNTGFLPLNLTAINATSSFGGITITGGSCTPITSLPENGSCTVTFTFGNEYLDDATISVTDNNEGVANTVQPVSVSYFLGLGGLVVPAGGTGGLFGANPLIQPTVNDIPRNLLNLNTSNATNNSTNKKGKKKLHR